MNADHRDDRPPDDPTEERPPDPSEVGAGVLGAVVALAIQSLVDHTLGVIAYRAALLAVLGLAIGLPIGSSVETTPQRQPVKTS